LTLRTISKKRLKKKIDALPDIQAAQLRKLITDMYGEWPCLYHPAPGNPKPPAGPAPLSSRQ